MTTVQLRNYQHNMIDQVRAGFVRKVRRILLQAPTGAGKTALGSFMAGGAAAKGQTVWFVVHRAELVTQTSLTFKRFGIAHGFIAAGWPMDLTQKVQICSIDTLKNRLGLLPPPNIIIWDECHHLGAAGWTAVMEFYSKAWHVGLSATPVRQDGRGLDTHFDEMVLGPSVAWLIENGFLSKYRIFGPPPPAELKARGRDDGRGAQAKVLNKPKLVGDVVAHWLKRANGMRTMGFACNVEHSKAMVLAFNAAGIPSAHLDGDTPTADRERIIREFAAGRILVLWNVALFGEGFDLAAIAQVDVTIDCVILNRQTRSLGLFLQMVGRALRWAEGKVAVILDHGGNGNLHGWPDDERDWDLKGRKSGGKGAKKDPSEEGPPPPYTCLKCFEQIKRPLPETCQCGAAIVTTSKAARVADGELQEITEADRRKARAQRQKEERDCKTLGELLALGQQRGYASPQGWAFKRWAVSPHRTAGSGKNVQKSLSAAH